MGGYNDGMLTEYIQAAMRKANYKLLDEEEGFFGEIADCPGVWANAATLEACREELQEVLEDWILIRARRQLDLPVIDGLDLNPKPVEPQEAA
jgi:predicted RNase H-like HicB family nuclease